jgi:hypothetical protein
MFSARITCTVPKIFHIFQVGSKTSSTMKLTKKKIRWMIRPGKISGLSKKLQKKIPNKNAARNFPEKFFLQKTGTSKLLTAIIQKIFGTGI